MYYVCISTRSQQVYCAHCVSGLWYSTCKVSAHSQKYGHLAYTTVEAWLDHHVVAPHTCPLSTSGCCILWPVLPNLCLSRLLMSLCWMRYRRGGVWGPWSSPPEQHAPPLHRHAHSSYPLGRARNFGLFIQSFVGVPFES